MNWLNIEINTLRSPEIVGAEPVERATWMMLLAYCAGQENAGTVKDCKGWKCRQWQQTAGVTLDEVTTDTTLWKWVGDDLILWSYPLDKEREVAAKRNGGRKGGIESGKSRKPKETAKKQAGGKAKVKAVSEGKLQGKLEALLERKGREGKGIEGEEKEKEREYKKALCNFSQSEFLQLSEENALILLATYAESLGYENFDPEKWYSFYAAKGFVVGKKQMESWKHGVRNAKKWAIFDPESEGTSAKPTDWTDQKTRTLYSVQGRIPEEHRALFDADFADPEYRAMYADREYPIPPEYVSSFNGNGKPPADLFDADERETV